MGIKENVDLKKNPITSILGLMTFMVSLSMFSLPLVIDLKEEPDIYISCGLGIVGLMLIIAPEKIVTILINPVVGVFTSTPKGKKTEEE